MKYLLDTCVVSEGISKRPFAPAVAWVEAQSAIDTFVSVMTIAEIAYAAMRLPVSRRRDQLERWLASIQRNYGDRVLPVDGAVAEVCGAIRAGADRQRRTMPAVDAMIAATAQVHGLVLVTRNVADFEVWGGTVFNPWQAEDRP